MEEPQYCLRWNNHQQNFITIFKNLLDFEELVDVTISVEGRQIKAHKVVLSACSPYFKILFSITPSKHPIVILNDIKYRDMKAIVDFIYSGEVSVSDEQLADILEIAETLQVKGLYDPKQNKQSSDNFTENQSKQMESAYENNTPLENIIVGQGVPDVGNVEPAPWSVEHMFGNESATEFRGNSLLQDREMNSEESSVKAYVTQPISPYIPVSVPNAMPGRRRNSKVQESENFLLALEAVRTGKLGFCKAAKLYGLNNRTLWLEYKKRGYPANRPPVRKVGVKSNT